MTQDLVIPDKSFWDCTAIDRDAWLDAVTDEQVSWPELDAIIDSDERDSDKVVATILAAINGQHGQVGPFCDLNDYRPVGRPYRANRRFDATPYELATHSNTSNNENNFDNDFAYAVFAPRNSDWVWSHEVYIAVSSGGYRGVGPDFTLYRVDSPADSGFLDWVVGWFAEYLDGESLEEFNERCGVGYSSHPTSEVEDFLKRYAVGSINGRAIGWRRGADTRKPYIAWSDKYGCHVSRDLTGRTIKLHPYINVS